MNAGWPGGADICGPRKARLPDANYAWVDGGAGRFRRSLPLDALRLYEGDIGWQSISCALGTKTRRGGSTTPSTDDSDTADTCDNDAGTTHSDSMSKC